MRFTSAVGILCCATALSVHAQPEIHWKSRVRGRVASYARQPIKRAATDNRHWLIQFAAAPTPTDLELLRLRGARIVSPAPEWGFVISGDDRLDLSGLNLAEIEEIQPAEKLSREIEQQPAGFQRRRAPSIRAYIVEFHPDVAPSRARYVLFAARARVLEHPQLLNQHYVVEGSPSAIERLAAWDEVSYVFPASEELLSGAPVTACYGAITENGAVGQSIALVGPGWASRDGIAKLNYALGPLTMKVGPDRLRAEIRRALGEWSKYLQVDFTEISQLTAFRTLAFRWGRGVTGGPLPFDGPGRMLAYTYYPAPPNPEPVAGDLYFDDDENWQVDNDVDVYSVVLHEVGHALGLGHSDQPGAVMYPYYRRALGLTPEDIAAARQLYSSREEIPGGMPDPGDAQPEDPTPEAPPKVNPPSDVPTLPKPTGDSSPPLLAITAPKAVTMLTSESSVRLVGTATDPSGILRVTWKSTLGAGVALGTANWTADVPLFRGVNAITVEATDNAGNTSWRSIVVTRR